MARDDDDDDDGDNDSADAKSLRLKLEQTSARALRALEAKDATIVHLRAALAKYENGSHLLSELEHDPRRNGWSYKAWLHASDTKENHVDVASERKQHKALEKSLEEERARVIDLRRELREANLHASKLEEAHEAAKRFALENEQHAERLGDAVKRVVSAREDFAQQREAAAITHANDLSAQVYALTAQSSRLREETEKWKSKACALEEALEQALEIKSHVEGFEADEDAADENNFSIDGESKRLKAKLIETQVALQEALGDKASRRVDGGAEAVEPSVASDFEAVIHAINTQKEDTRVVATMESRLTSLQIEVKELRATNRVQVEDLERLENSLREQLALNRATIDASEITADTASRENARLQSLLRDREDDILILRDTVAALENDRAPKNEEWRQREIDKTREKLYALESENSRLTSQSEIIAGEAVRLRHELDVEAERARMFEQISKAAKRREEILVAQMGVKTEECTSFMDGELALLQRLEELERSNLETEIKLVACEKSLISLTKRFDQSTLQKLDVLKQSIHESVNRLNNSPAHLDISASFCQSIRSCFRNADGVQEQLIEALLAAQRTIVQLECHALTNECAVSIAVRHIGQTEHRASSMKTAFDHVCAILALSQSSHASLKSTALASLESRLSATRVRNTKLNELLMRGELRSSSALEGRDIEDELFERDEKIRSMQVRIEELEVTSNELLGAREAAASAMQSMSVARDKAKKELFDEQDRVREYRETILQLKSEITRLREHSEMERVEVEGLRHARMVSEAEAKARVQIAEDNTHRLQKLHDDVVAQLADEREQVRIMREKQSVDLENDTIDISLQETASEDARVAAVVAAAALQDAEQSKVEIDRLREELARRGEKTYELEHLRASIENGFSSHNIKLDEFAEFCARDACTAQAFTDVMTARLLNLEAEIAEQKKREEEWLASAVPSDDEKKAHVERCQRYRDIMRRMQDEHERERDRLLAIIKDSEVKIAELSIVYSDSRLGLANAQLREPQQRSEKIKLEGEDTELEQVKSQLERHKARRLREIARHEDEIERVRESAAQCARPALALVDAVRSLACALVRVSTAGIAHEKRVLEASVPPTARNTTMDEVANLVGLSVDDLSAVFDVENVHKASSADDVSIALRMQPSPANAHSAIAWCVRHADTLNVALTSSLTWDDHVLADIVKLLQSQLSTLESMLRKHDAVDTWIEELNSFEAKECDEEAP